MNIKNLQGQIIAHRGFYDNQKYPENSMQAFIKAVKHKYPIELDVQLTKDKKLVVFHDETLKRLCNQNIKVKDTTYVALQKYSILQTKETIPLLTDVLKCIDGKVPLDIEIKKGGVGQIEPLIAELLNSYKGEFVITSFHPMIVYWFKKHRPEYQVGILLKSFNSYFIKWKEWLYYIFLKYVVKPDFIACDIRYLPNRITNYLHLPIVSWTVRTEQELLKAKLCSNVYIVETILKERDL